MEVDPTVLKDRGAYYRARVVYFEHLLKGWMLPKQRREAEAELSRYHVKALRYKSNPES